MISSRCNRDATPLRCGSLISNRAYGQSDAVVESIVHNYGKSEVLTRMSDPNWFQALVL